ncbi:hypothetical protein [Alkalihalobacillus sp. AL-G]|uniref:hypothetical protein n=1 Tax=Alkalihalobacillus sp. AL-G TaxID=2926399 RepID=UPI00272D8250|nr:hypothetical protein [Alkalihalobacillus sp. AL-G]WLD91645.1 hypothetical protein MOJ78_11370 [Alkalihalobacillus sp. AL-G]
MFYVLGYASPLLLILFFFLAAFFLMTDAAKLILFIYLLWIIALPFVLLYKEEVIDYRKRTDSHENERSIHTGKKKVQRW